VACQVVGERASVCGQCGTYDDGGGGYVFCGGAQHCCM
jgi:hypothetical protein